MKIYNHPVFFVYMVRCADGTLYTGYARDAYARVDVHNAGKGAKYTRSRLPVTLVYTEECDSLSAALKRESQLKPWSRARKEALISGAPAATAGVGSTTNAGRLSTALAICRDRLEVEPHG